MKHSFLLILSLLGFQISSIAQTDFEVVAGNGTTNSCYAAIQTHDSGYVAVGQIMAPSGTWDVFVVKLEANGDTAWTREYGDQFDDGASAVQQTFEGGYIVSGYLQ